MRRHRVITFPTAAVTVNVMRFASVILVAMLFAFTATHSAADTPPTLWVATDGVDADDRDGSKTQALRTLGYACERIAKSQRGDDEVATIHIRSGVHYADRVAVAPPRTRIVGNGFHGDGSNFSIIRASDAFIIPEVTSDKDAQDAAESLLHVPPSSDGVTVYGVQFESPDGKDGSMDRPIGGGICLQRTRDVNIDTCRFDNFRWFGVRADICENVEIASCGFRRCSRQRRGHRLGNITTRFLKNSRIHHCRVAPDPDGGGYGYKGGGHEGVSFDHNTVTRCYFAIESPHENEFGFEIHHNDLDGAISVPKGGQGADPNERGFKHAVEIHHNRMLDSYGIEGPRNHMRVHHNHIYVQNNNGRIYAQFGGLNDGPVVFDHNVIENVDRNLLWVRTGRAADVTFRCNTVFLSEAGTRRGDVFSIWSGEHIDDWTIEKNLIVAAFNGPRRLFRNERGVGDKIIVRDNHLVHLTDLPDAVAANNRVGGFPNLVGGDASKPFPFFEYADGNAIVGATAEGGEPFEVGPK